MKSGQRHDLQQNRQNISIGEVLIHKEGGRTYEELETTDSIGVKRNDACITGRVQYHNIKNRSGKREKSGGSGKESLEGAHVFMFKSTGNSFGDLMYEGFEEYLSGKGQKTVYKSPAETTVAAQVQMLDELITQKVASITISTNGDAGYNEVFKKAKEAGIPIVSVDSEASPDYRVCHVNQAETADIGSYLVQAAVLITLGVDYPGDGKMEETVQSELKSYKGDEIKLGVLSASIDTPVQNSWIAAMEDELSKDFYAGKVIYDTGTGIYCGKFCRLHYFTNNSRYCSGRTGSEIFQQ